MSDNNKRKMLYDGLVKRGDYHGTFDEFSTKFSDKEKMKQLYDGCVQRGYYHGKLDEFENKFFSDIETPSVQPTAEPQPADQPQAVAQPAETEDENYIEAPKDDFGERLKQRRQKMQQPTNSPVRMQIYRDDFEEPVQPEKPLWKAIKEAGGTEEFKKKEGNVTFSSEYGYTTDREAVEEAEYLVGIKNPGSTHLLTDEEKAEIRKKTEDDYIKKFGIKSMFSIEQQSMIKELAEKNIEEENAKRQAQINKESLVEQTSFYDNNTADGRRKNFLINQYAMNTSARGEKTPESIESAAIKMWLMSPNGINTTHRYYDGEINKEQYLQLIDEGINKDMGSFIYANSQDEGEFQSKSENDRLLEKILSRQQEEQNKQAEKERKFESEHPFTSGIMRAGGAYDSNREYYTNNQNIVTARKLAEDSQKVISGAKSNGFWEALGKGTLHEATNLDNWIAFNEFNNNMNIMAVANIINEKGYDEGYKSLNKDQKLMWDAFVNNAAVNMYYGEKLSKGYKIGSTTGASIPFMLEFAVLPYSGVESAISKAIIKTAEKRVIKAGLRKAVEFGAEKVVAPLASSMLFTATVDAPKVAAGASRRMLGDANVGLNAETNEIEYKGQENQQGLGEATWNAGVETWAGNYSERSLDPLLKLGGGKVRGLLGADEGGVGRFLNSTFFSNPVMKGAQFESIFGEYAEELFNNAITAALCTDQNFADNFSGQQLEETFEGLLPTQFVMSLFGAGHGLHTNFKINKSVKSQKQKMIGELRVLGGMPEGLEDNAEIKALTKEAAQKIRTATVKLQDSDGEYTQEDYDKDIKAIREEYDDKMLDAYKRANESYQASLSEQELKEDLTDEQKADIAKKKQRSGIFGKFVDVIIGVREKKKSSSEQASNSEGQTEEKPAAEEQVDVYDTEDKHSDVYLNGIDYELEKDDKGRQLVIVQLPKEYKWKLYYNRFASTARLADFVRFVSDKIENDTFDFDKVFNSHYQDFLQSDYNRNNQQTKGETTPPASDKGNNNTTNPSLEEGTGETPPPPAEEQKKLSPKERLESEEDFDDDNHYAKVYDPNNGNGYYMHWYSVNGFVEDENGVIDLQKTYENNKAHGCKNSGIYLIDDINEKDSSSHVVTLSKLDRTPNAHSKKPLVNPPKTFSQLKYEKKHKEEIDAANRKAEEERKKAAAAAAEAAKHVLPTKKGKDGKVEYDIKKFTPINLIEYLRDVRYKGQADWAQKAKAELISALLTGSGRPMDRLWNLEAQLSSKKLDIQQRLINEQAQDRALDDSIAMIELMKNYGIIESEDDVDIKAADQALRDKYFPPKKEKKAKEQKEQPAKPKTLEEMNGEELFATFLNENGETAENCPKTIEDVKQYIADAMQFVESKTEQLKKPIAPASKVRLRGEIKHTNEVIEQLTTELEKHGVSNFVPEVAPVAEEPLKPAKEAQPAAEEPAANEPQSPSETESKEPETGTNTAEEEARLAAEREAKLKEEQERKAAAEKEKAAAKRQKSIDNSVAGIESLVNGTEKVQGATSLATEIDELANGISLDDTDKSKVISEEHTKAKEISERINAIAEEAKSLDANVEGSDTNGKELLKEAKTLRSQLAGLRKTIVKNIEDLKAQREAEEARRRQQEIIEKESAEDEKKSPVGESVLDDKHNTTTRKRKDENGKEVKVAELSYRKLEKNLDSITAENVAGETDEKELDKLYVLYRVLNNKTSGQPGVDYLPKFIVLTKEQYDSLDGLVLSEIKRSYRMQKGSETIEIDGEKKTVKKNNVLLLHSYTTGGEYEGVCIAYKKGNETEVVKFDKNGKRPKGKNDKNVTIKKVVKKVVNKKTVEEAIFLNLTTSVSFEEYNNIAKLGIDKWLKQHNVSYGGKTVSMYDIIYGKANDFVRLLHNSIQNDRDNVSDVITSVKGNLQHIVNFYTLGLNRPIGLMQEPFLSFNNDVINRKQLSKTESEYFDLLDIIDKYETQGLLSGGNISESVDDKKRKEIQETLDKFHEAEKKYKENLGKEDSGKKESSIDKNNKVRQELIEEIKEGLKDYQVKGSSDIEIPTIDDVVVEEKKESEWSIQDKRDIDDIAYAISDVYERMSFDSERSMYLTEEAGREEIEKIIRDALDRGLREEVVREGEKVAAMKRFGNVLYDFLATRTEDRTDSQREELKTASDAVLSVGKTISEAINYAVENNIIFDSAEEADFVLNENGIDTEASVNENPHLITNDVIESVKNTPAEEVKETTVQENGDSFESINAAINELIEAKEELNEAILDDEDTTELDKRVKKATERLREAIKSSKKTAEELNDYLNQLREAYRKDHDSEIIVEVFNEAKEPQKGKKGNKRYMVSNGRIIGSYNIDTGEVEIEEGLSDELRTRVRLHEIVGHKGLRYLLGDKFDALCDEVYDYMEKHLSKDDYDLFKHRAEMELPEGAPELAVHRVMADEWMAHRAEYGVSQHRSIWNRIVDFIRAALRDLGFDLELSERDVAMLLYESNLRLEGRDMTAAERMEYNSVYNHISESEAGIGYKAKYESAFGIKLVYRTNGVSPEENAAYMEAARRGDEEKCKEMLDVIAERFGYVPSKHGTNNGGFVKIDMSKSDDGISFFSSPDFETARSYVGDGDILSTKHFKNREEQQKKLHILSQIRKIFPYGIMDTYALVDKDGNIVSDNSGLCYFDKPEEAELYNKQDFDGKYKIKKKLIGLNDSENYFFDTFDDISKYLIDEFYVYEGDRELLNDVYKYVYLSDEYEHIDLRGLYDLYVRFDNPLVIDADGRYWKEITLNNDTKKIYASMMPIDYNNPNGRVYVEFGSDVVLDENWNPLIEQADDYEYHEFESIDAAKEFIKSEYGEGIWDDIYKRYNRRDWSAFKHLELENPMVRLRAEYKFLWNTKTKTEELGFTTREIAEQAKEGGYDGVIINNVIDNGGESNVWKLNPATVYISFNPNQIKSAEAITYDDNGEIIPLHRRFNERTNDIRYMFIGEKGADSLNGGFYSLRNAKKMLKNGSSKKEIKKKTGWELGADGEWRYEITDGELVNVPDSPVFCFLCDIFDSNKLYDAYQSFIEMKVLIIDNESEDFSGEYNPYEDVMTINLAHAKTPEQIKKTIIHELQHAVQHIEGFDTGTNPDSEIAKRYVAKFRDDIKLGMTLQIGGLREAKYLIEENNGNVDDVDTSQMSKAAKYYIDYYKENFKNDSKEDWDLFCELEEDAIKGLRDEGTDADMRQDFYHQKSGEVEARNAERRMNMTAEERRNSLGEETEDVERGSQLFTEGLRDVLNLDEEELSKAESVAYSMTHDIEGKFVPVSENKALDKAKSKREEENPVHTDYDSEMRKYYNKAVAEIVDEFKTLKWIREKLAKITGKRMNFADDFVESAKAIKRKAKGLHKMFTQKYLAPFNETTTEITRKFAKEHGGSATDAKMWLDNYMMCKDYLERIALKRTGYTENSAKALWDNDPAMKSVKDKLQKIYGVEFGSMEEFVEKSEDMFGDLTNMWNQWRTMTYFICDTLKDHDMPSDKAYAEMKERKFYVPQRNGSESSGNLLDVILAQAQKEDEERQKAAQSVTANAFEKADRAVNKGRFTAFLKARGRKSLAAMPVEHISNIAFNSFRDCFRNDALRKFYNAIIGNPEAQAIAKEYGITVEAPVMVTETDSDNNKTKRAALAADFAEMAEKKKALKEFAKEIFKLQRDKAKLQKWLNEHKNYKGSLKYDIKVDARDFLEEQIKAKKEEFNRMKAEANAKFSTQEVDDKKNPNQMVMKLNGLTYRFTIADNAYGTMTAQAFDYMPPRRPIPLATTLNRFISRNLTSRNPFFAPITLKRGSEYSVLAAYIQNPLLAAKIFKNLWDRKSILPVIQYVCGSEVKDPLLEEFIRLGGSGSYTSNLSDLDEIAKELNEMYSKNFFVLFKKFGNKFLSVLNEAAEIWERFAIFKAAKECGYTSEEALAESKELDQNFDTQGRGQTWLLRAAKAVIPFFNAAMGSIVALRRSVYDKNVPHRSGGRKAAAARAGLVIFGNIMKGFLSVVLSKLILSALYGDGDDDNEQQMIDYANGFNDEYEGTETNKLINAMHYWNKYTNITGYSLGPVKMPSEQRLQFFGVGLGADLGARFIYGVPLNADDIIARQIGPRLMATMSPVDITRPLDLPMVKAITMISGAYDNRGIWNENEAYYLNSYNSSKDMDVALSKVLYELNHGTGTYGQPPLGNNKERLDFAPELIKFAGNMTIPAPCREFAILMYKIGLDAGGDWWFSDNPNSMTHNESVGFGNKWATPTDNFKSNANIIVRELKNAVQDAEDDSHISSNVESMAQHAEFNYDELRKLKDDIDIAMIEKYNANGYMTPVGIQIIKAELDNLSMFDIRKKAASEGLMVSEYKERMYDSFKQDGMSDTKAAEEVAKRCNEMEKDYNTYFVTHIVPLYLEYRNYIGAAQKVDSDWLNVDDKRELTR